MKKLAAIGAISLLASSLFAQGLNTGGQTKDDWEEINFEFNSSILSDGYPSLLRLAELLSQHRDYKVKVTGHTDYVGSAAYNDKLAQKRADAVKVSMMKGDFVIFKGPLKDNTGKTVIDAGVAQKQTDVVLEQMNYLVEGVIGRV